MCIRDRVYRAQGPGLGSWADQPPAAYEVGWAYAPPPPYINHPYPKYPCSFVTHIQVRIRLSSKPACRGDYPLCLVDCALHHPGMVAPTTAQEQQACLDTNARWTS
eukprot:9359042-Pyramimonas_sp.AAC.1